MTAGYRANPIPGMVANYAYRMDADPQEYYLAVIFESKEAYHTNAQSPEQHQRFEQMMQLLEGEPEWHDGEIVDAGDSERTGGAAATRPARQRRPRTARWSVGDPHPQGTGRSAARGIARWSYLASRARPSPPQTPSL